MEHFEIGQRVRVVDNEVTAGWFLRSRIGKEFVIGYVDSYDGLTEFEGMSIPPRACELVGDDNSNKTPFQRVSEMNEAFGNPKGDYKNIDWNRVRSQYRNIFDEYCEGLKALGLDAFVLGLLQDAHNKYVTPEYFTNEPEPLEVRDALADIQVFKDGALHFMGVDGDADMHAVIDGVMTRFVKNDEDKAATIALHAAKGVTDVYFEGEYPKMVMKSAKDQPDAPKGKFLKSASYTNTVFPEVI